MLTDFRAAVRSVVLQSLQGRRRQPSVAIGEIDEEAGLVALGLADSEDLVEIILEVEERCECEFNPEAIDSSEELTLRSLVSAFVAKERSGNVDAAGAAALDAAR